MHCGAGSFLHTVRKMKKPVALRYRLRITPTSVGNTNTGLLALYAVWSARKIMRLSAVLHILVRMLGEMLEEEPQDLTNSADRLY